VLASGGSRIGARTLGEGANLRSVEGELLSHGGSRELSGMVAEEKHLIASQMRNGVKVTRSDPSYQPARAIGPAAVIR
jgi:hypothetical protein